MKGILPILHQIDYKITLRGKYSHCHLLRFFLEQTFCFLLTCCFVFITLAEMKEVPVLIVGDNCLLSWPQSEHPNLCCSGESMIPIMLLQYHSEVYRNSTGRCFTRFLDQFCLMYYVCLEGYNRSLAGDFAISMKNTLTTA